MIKKAVDLSFAGCGFLGTFHVGSYAAFKNSEKVTLSSCLGSSSGAVVACAAAADMDPAWLEMVFRDIVRSTAQYRLGPFSKHFDVGRIIEEAFKDLPSDIHLKVSKKLTIAITDLKWKSVLVSDFKSKADLQDCLKCSTFLPIFSGRKIPTFRGRKYVDGGLTNQMPILNSDTIKISPFSGRFKNICPEDTSRLNITIARENIFINRENLQRGIEAITHQNDLKLSRFYDSGYKLSEKYLENICLMN